MLLAVIAWLVAVACVAVGAQRFRKVLALASEANALLADLRNARRSERSWSDYPRLASELGSVLDAASVEESVAAMNERLGEVARELAVGAELPRACARIGLFSGVILGVIELARTVPLPGGAALGTSGAALIAGISAAAVGFDLDRRARKEAGRAREAWNAISPLAAGTGKSLRSARSAQKHP